jgi:hypothetical protein
MNEEVARLATELASDDTVERSRAAWMAGGLGADATTLLPRLSEMLSRNLVLESTANRCGEYVSVGRILSSIHELRKQEAATDEMILLADHCTSTVMSLLESATGARASLLIYTLALSGPQAKHAASIVSRVATRLEDQLIKYRAYQFACSVCPELASNPPWSDFAPTNDEDRRNWGALRYNRN